MKPFAPISKRTERVAIVAILLLFAGVSLVGITWGLPSRDIDTYLFGDDKPWSGEKIYRLAGAAEKLTTQRSDRFGADVDVDALDKNDGEPILLTGTDEDIAKIYLRYRLYTYQPDEMITMMSLAGMNPRKLQLDPRLYQYGGLFIYPVGGLIGACGLVGLIDVRSDVVYYLDNPDEFGKFYVVARAYSAMWGMVGVLVVFAIGRRLCGSRAGLLGALLFTLMPVVVCMAHEGKPHLPGAVLMLLAVWFAMRYLQTRTARGTCSGAIEYPSNRPNDLDAYPGAPGPRGADATSPSGERASTSTSDRSWWLMCVCCGASFGMVLSSAPIFVLIPLVALMERRGLASAIKRTIYGVALAFAVYFVTNPYVLINAVFNREVLASNFGNSLAMYQIDRIAEGFVRVLELTVEGATLPILVLGVLALLVAIVTKRTRAACFSLRERPSDKDRAETSERESATNVSTSEEPTAFEASRGLKPAAREETAAEASPLRLAMLPLAIPAAVFFLQFVAIGAGKPAEYGRFGVFTNTALAIGAACLLTARWVKLREIVNWVFATPVLIWVCLLGATYVKNFWIDARDLGQPPLSVSERGLRESLAYTIHEDLKHLTDYYSFLVTADPAPYCCPPMRFSKLRVWKYASVDNIKPASSGWTGYVLVPEEEDGKYTFGGCSRFVSWWPGWANTKWGNTQGYVDVEGRLNIGNPMWALWIRPTPISWANKPFHAMPTRVDPKQE